MLQQVFQFLCYNSCATTIYTHVHVCSRISGSAPIRLLRVRQAPTCSTLKRYAQYTEGVFFGALVCEVIFIMIWVTLSKPHTAQTVSSAMDIYIYMYIYVGMARKQDGSVTGNLDAREFGRCGNFS